ncbi:DUF1800 family protein [Aquincola sp. MAHUQ-54]|uniref:DUF1800 family protein n=1 Tax=Aquincola agrisoli TaxID=3119538 RepID=A0AAW9QCW4_9BURK
MTPSTFFPAPRRAAALALLACAAAPAFGAATLTLRAWADLAADVGAQMQLRVDGQVIGTVEVRSTAASDYRFTVPALQAGSKVEVVFLNDGGGNGQDRNLHVGSLASGSQTVTPQAAGAVFDRGGGALAFDGLDLLPAQSGLYWSGALRLTWPAAPVDPAVAAKQAAARLLMQGSFGPTMAELTRVSQMTPAAWIAEQMALPFTPSYVDHVQGRYARGDAWRPGGANYDPTWIGQHFWANAAKAPDQLRHRVGWALHQVLTVSQADPNLWAHTRAYAGYLDTLNRHAFGNYRALLEAVALSPATGLYLSHLRNRKEDAATGRVPDENFARELMQLFTIGLHELNIDGTPRRDAAGRPIETYGNADVSALARVFTGWSWGFADNQLTDANFRWREPELSAARDDQADLQRMKAYPGQHSGAEKRLFAGKPHAVVLAAGNTAQEDVRLALDALFRHPNVGPFIGRQLIQRLVKSHPSPGYVGRVAGVFNNNGQGVRGDLGAVVKAILLDAEARTPGAGPAEGKLREPVLRVAHWMRALGARSVTGEYLLSWELEPSGQHPMFPPSVFGYYRPGYVPPLPGFAAGGVTAPELQIVNEVSAAAWVDLALSMSWDGLGWTGAGRDIVPDVAPLAALARAGNVGGLVDRLDLLLFAGRMSAGLRQAVVDTVLGVGGTTEESHLHRARAALLVALASNEFQVQR